MLSYPVTCNSTTFGGNVIMKLCTKRMKENIKKLLVAVVCIPLLYAGINIFATSEIVYVNVKEEKSEAEIIAERIEAIYNSEEFESEMRALAEARALFELSNETQSNAVSLSERAMQSFQNSKAMNEAWYDKQNK